MFKEKIKVKLDSVKLKENTDANKGDTDPVKHGRETSVKDKVKTNPLDDFLMLRTVPVKREETRSPPKKLSKITSKMALTHPNSSLCRSPTS